MSTTELDTRAIQLSVCRGRPLCLPGGRASTGGRPYSRTPLDNWRTEWPCLTPRGIQLFVCSGRPLCLPETGAARRLHLWAPTRGRPYMDAQKGCWILH
jgi:hypothetical protein